MLRLLATCALVAISSHALALDQLVVGAMGDSISTGFNAQRLGDNREFSWSTGSSNGLRSYSKRIEELRQRPVVSYNEAIAGSISADLDRQTSRLLRHTPDYVTITIGANDICRWSDSYDAQLATFEIKVRHALDRLITANEQVTIVLSPIPDLYHLWEISHQQAGCQERWDMLNVCHTLLGRDVTENQRQAFIRRWHDANHALERIAESHPDQVRFDADLARIRFDWQHVSTKDCFHPSVSGQNLLAEIAWQMILADN